MTARPFTCQHGSFRSEDECSDCAGRIHPAVDWQARAEEAEAAVNDLRDQVEIERDRVRELLGGPITKSSEPRAGALPGSSGNLDQPTGDPKELCPVGAQRRLDEGGSGGLRPPAGVCGAAPPDPGLLPRGERSEQRNGYPPAEKLSVAERTELAERFQRELPGAPERLRAGAVVAALTEPTCFVCDFPMREHLRECKPEPPSRSERQYREQAARAVLFDFGDGGTMSYVSNAQRADMVKALEELLGKLRPA